MAHKALEDSRARLAGQALERTHSHVTGELLSEKEVFINLITALGTPNEGLMCFTTPSPSALALREAIDAGEFANRLRSSLAVTEVSSPLGMLRYLGREQMTELFDCVQKSMVCATFSYLALEVFCNEEIARKPNELVSVERPDKHGKWKTLNLPAKQLERKSSTEEKLHVVLPQLLGIDSPKGKAEWQHLKLLQAARNNTVHLKAETVNPRVMSKDKIDRESLFYTFLTQDALRLPRAAVKMSLYFVPDERQLSWLVEPCGRLQIE